MIDPATPDALKAIASMMRMDGYRTDAFGVEAAVIDNAAAEIELLDKFRTMWAEAKDENERLRANLYQEEAETEALENKLAAAVAENEKVRKSLHISHMYILSCQLWDDFDKYSRGKRVESK
jgi:septal ring factor EnvC (AmiA/AmiB activator)